MRPVVRRGTAAAALLGGLVSVSGCGANTPPAAGGRPVIAVVSASAHAGFAVEMAAGFRAGAEEVGGVDIEAAAPQTVDGPREVQLLADISERAKQGITVHPVVPALFATQLAELSSQGIPLIAIDTPPAPSSRVSLFIGNDNVELGRMLAREPIKRLPAGASGTVLVGSPQPGAAPLDQRLKGLRQEFEARRPGVRVLGPLLTKHERQANVEVWTGLVDANPKALAFVGLGDGDAVALAGLHKARAASWLAAGFDLAPEATRGVRDGDLVALVSPEHFLKGGVAGRLQAMHAKSGAKLPTGSIYTPGLLVTSGNVAEVASRQASDAAKRAWFKPKVAEVVDHLDRYRRSPDKPS